MKVHGRCCTLLCGCIPRVDVSGCMPRYIPSKISHLSRWECHARNGIDGNQIEAPSEHAVLSALRSVGAMFSRRKPMRSSWYSDLFFVTSEHTCSDLTWLFLQSFWWTIHTSLALWLYNQPRRWRFNMLPPTATLTVVYQQRWNKRNNVEMKSTPYAAWFLSEVDSSRATVATAHISNGSHSVVPTCDLISVPPVTNNNLACCW